MVALVGPEERWRRMADGRRFADGRGGFADGRVLLPIARFNLALRPTSTNTGQIVGISGFCIGKVANLALY